MGATNAQKKATSKYRSVKVKQVNVPFYPGDQYLYEHLSLQKSKAGYIKDLIEKDMKESAQ